MKFRFRQKEFALVRENVITATEIYQFFCSNVLQFIESHTGAELSSCSGPLARPDLKASIHELPFDFKLLLLLCLFPRLPPLHGIIALIGTPQHFCLSAKQDPHTGSDVVDLFPPLQNDAIDIQARLSESRGYLGSHCITKLLKK